MSLRRTWNDLLEMYSSGGLQVLTLVDELPEEDTAVSPPPYHGKIYDRQGVRTVIQLDSDYMTVMSPEVVLDPELWRRHTAVIQSKFDIFRRLQMMARQSWLLFLIIPALWLAPQLATQGWPDVLWSIIGSAGMGTVIVLARKWILKGLAMTVLPLIQHVFGAVARRRLDQFLAQKL
ncbi:MAG: hypothetical protein GY796_13785 [Chloroflexi bacterium]|nr:hypothetical protein [Chloroflexota bacterium]